MFNSIYKNKKVLITGNTGFKGSWLTIWLLSLGAKVYGISNGVPTHPSVFEGLELEEKIKHIYLDVLNLPELKRTISEISPDFLFHLAAQPIVSLSYQEPLQTMAVNIMGTANVLEAMRQLKNPCQAVFITSDKCYENLEWKWGYRESDHLGGKDPYSASKGACELVIHSFYHSYFKDKLSHISIASARAGNVIGGGDWAVDRIIPDAVRAWVNNESVELRNPAAVRPWQHVLEPLSGYLRLGQKLAGEKLVNGEAYNFGPTLDKVYAVSELLDHFARNLSLKPGKPFYTIDETNKFQEAGYLKLNCDKALADLQWQPALSLSDAVNMTALWYMEFYKNNSGMYNFTISQIDEYISKARDKGLSWSKI